MALIFVGLSSVGPIFSKRICKGLILILQQSAELEVKTNIFDDLLLIT